jgi:hypothetical protein
VSTTPNKFADKVKPPSGKPPLSAEQLRAAFQESARPIVDELKENVTRIVREHVQGMTAAMRETILASAEAADDLLACALAERDEVIRRLSERVAALEAANAAGR